MVLEETKRHREFVTFVSDHLHTGSSILPEYIRSLSKRIVEAEKANNDHALSSASGGRLFTNNPTIDLSSLMLEVMRRNEEREQAQEQVLKELGKLCYMLHSHL